MTALFSVLFLFCGASIAESNLKAGGMYRPDYLVKRIKTEAKTKTHCSGATSGEGLQDTAFSVTLRCEKQCEGDAAKSEFETSRVFDPTQEGLGPGDGHQPPEFILPRSFGITLSIWAERSCLDAARLACPNEKLRQVALKKISSGDWSLDRRPTCDPNAAVVYSPYDPRHKIERKKTLGGGLFLSPPRTTPSAQHTGKFCRVEITGESCFGDCVLLGADEHSKVPLVLMTPESPAKEKKTVCADPLVEKHHSVQMSANEAEILCREYFFRTLVKTNAMGTSCAAFRADPDCTQVIRTLSSSN
jgi:hypothetical protein